MKVLSTFQEELERGEDLFDVTVDIGPWFDEAHDLVVTETATGRKLYAFWMKAGEDHLQPGELEMLRALAETHMTSLAMNQREDEAEDFCDECEIVQFIDHPADVQVMPDYDCAQAA